MQYPTYIHNYGCWRSNEGLPDNLEKPSNNFAQLSTSWRLSLHLHVFFRSLEVIYLKGNNFVKIICEAINYLHQEYHKNSAWETIQPLLVDTWSICSSYRTIIWRTFKNIIIWKKVHSCTSSIPFQARNDFDLRLTVWEEMLLFCFVFNNVHYACYGTYYVN